MTQEEYLNEIIRVLQGNFHPDDTTGSMTAARVGLLMRQVVGKGPQEAGFAQLKDVLSELERRGVIRTGTNSKNAYAIWLPRAGTPVETSAATIAPRRSSGPFRRLRQPIWYAFVGTVPIGRRFLNRKTGDVRLGQDSPPSPADEWVEIEPLDQTDERAKAKHFLGQEGITITPAIQAALESDRWYVDLSRHIDPTVAIRWKRHRTGRVVELVEKWRQERDIPGDLVYEERPPTSAPRRSFESKSELRDLLLAAISRLSTDELLALSLPSRYLISHLRPDLLEH